MLATGIVILLVGVPGSGKSYYINEFRKKNPDKRIAICSADHFFSKSGEYKFDPKQLGSAHDECYEKFYSSLHANIPVVFVDNTNILAAHRDRYITTARKFNYAVELIVFKPDVELSAKRNVHGVPKHAIERMATQMDIPPGKYKIEFDPSGKYLAVPLSVNESTLIKDILLNLFK